MIIPGQPKIPSPCGKGCEYDSSVKMCKSCGRTLEEIGNWSKYNDEQRLAVIERLKLWETTKDGHN